MTLATKNGAIIVKDGKLAEGCGCCGNDCAYVVWGNNAPPGGTCESPVFAGTVRVTIPEKYEISAGGLQISLSQSGFDDKGVINGQASLGGCIANTTPSCITITNRTIVFDVYDTAGGNVGMAACICVIDGKATLFESTSFGGISGPAGSVTAGGWTVEYPAYKVVGPWANLIRFCGDGDLPVCCGGNKTTSDPADEGDWVPSGAWPSVTWTFSETPSEKEWFFFGSFGSSNKGGNASVIEREDWANPCNWYSASSHSPATVTSGNFGIRLIRRATTLPTSDAIIHVYSTINTGSARTVKTAYFHEGQLKSGSSLTATSAAHGTTFNTVFSGFSSNSGAVAGGALFGGGIFNSCINNLGAVVNGGAEFLQDSFNRGTVNGGYTFKSSTFNDTSGAANGGGIFFGNSYNLGTASGGATFDGNPFSGNDGTVNGGATFNGRINNGTVNNGAAFNNASNAPFGIVNGGGTFSNNSSNYGSVSDSATFANTSFNTGSGTVNGGATFNDNTRNNGTVNGGATFNSTSQNQGGGTVNGGATFNDAACSTRLSGGLCSATPCNRKFVAHPTDLPTCNGTAPTGCANTCTTSCGCN